MKTFINPTKEKWEEICKRPEISSKNLTKQVNAIFNDIRNNKDNALFKYTLEFDKVKLKKLEVCKEEIEASSLLVSDTLKDAILLAKRNIEKFHQEKFVQKNMVETSKGVRCWQEYRAIEKVGLYIPGGSAPLFSTVLMLAIPAKLAGCNEIILCTPPNKKGEINPAILFAAKITGVSKIFKVGGIQAIGALTWGTESIPKVYKIFGPGNQYVTAAKQIAQNYGVAIDLPAGPSELLVIADNTANPAFVAADILSQAEHGTDSHVILLSTNINIINKVMSEIRIQIKALPRKNIAEKALEQSNAVLLENINECISFSNMYAPEHLILAVYNTRKYISNIINAGSVFLGNLSCESAGDYASGTNHTLPTNGYARNYSGVSLESFVKKITFQEINKTGLKNIGPAIELMAEAESLYAHKNAVTIRLKNL